VYGKVPPNSKEVEVVILGGMMVEPKSVLEVKEILKPSDFYLEAHQEICKAIFEISDTAAVDIILVIDYLKTFEKLDAVGGMYYITTLTNGVVSTANIKNHCRIIKQQSIKRALIEFAGVIIGKGYEDSEDVFEILDEAEQKLKGINFELDDMKITQLQDIGTSVIEKFDTKVHCAKNNIINENDVFTRIPEWDKINGALFPGLYIVAGRPGMGKGVHLTEVACRMAKEWPIGIINGEMTNEQLMVRMACNLKGLNNFLWKKNPADISEEEQQSVHDAVNEAIGLKIKIYDQRDIHRIANKIKLWVEKDGVRCILADFLTLFKISEERSKFFSEQQRINYILEIFASLAKELKVPIILYVQMNRDIEKRTGSKEPNLADIKGSGTIEEYAYQISFLHRPEYYDTNDTVDELGSSTKDLCYQIIAKHRDGEKGRIKHHAVLQSSQLKEWHDHPTVESSGRLFTGGNWRPVSEFEKL
jgi:replicative DNA helicase